MNSAPVPADSPQRVNLLGLDRIALEAFCVRQGEKPFRASQLLQNKRIISATSLFESTLMSKNSPSRSLARYQELPR